MKIYVGLQVYILVKIEYGGLAYLASWNDSDCDVVELRETNQA